MCWRGGVVCVKALTDGADAELKAELRRQLLVGLESALEVDNLQVF